MVFRFELVAADTPTPFVAEWTSSPSCDKSRVSDDGLRTHRAADAFGGASMEIEVMIPSEERWELVREGEATGWDMGLRI